MKYVYMVQLDRSATDSDSIETELYEDYDKAYDRYKEIISEQLKNFWKNEVNFDTDGDPGEEYEFFEDDNNSNESDVYWHLSLKYDYYIHTFVDLIRTPLYTKRSDEPQYIVRYKENEYSFRSGADQFVVVDCHLVDPVAGYYGVRRIFEIGVLEPFVFDVVDG